MKLTLIYRCVAAVDVHRAKLTVCVIYEDENGEVHVELREFGGVTRDRRAIAQWIGSFCPEIVVMESTGIYWNSPYAALGKAGMAAVVSDIHGKSVRAMVKGLLNGETPETGIALCEQPSQSDRGRTTLGCSGRRSDVINA